MGMSDERRARVWEGLNVLLDGATLTLAGSSVGVFRHMVALVFGVEAAMFH